MNNVATPTVSGPSVQIQGMNPNGMMNIVAQITELPRVASTAEAKTYHGKAGTQDVLLDISDPEIAYFRQIDVNGNIQIDRRRCVSEPEPTQQELNDKRYLSREEFGSFMDEFKSFREEMRNSVRAISELSTTKPDSSNDQSVSYVAGSGKNSGKSKFNASTNG